MIWSYYSHVCVSAYSIYVWYKVWAEGKRGGVSRADVCILRFTLYVAPLWPEESFHFLFFFFLSLEMVLKRRRVSGGHTRWLYFLSGRIGTGEKKGVYFL